MKKKLRGPFCIVLAALIALLSFPAGAAGGIVAGGECGGSGSNVTWTLNQEGLLTVSGTGTMYDYATKEDVPWYSYRAQITKAEIQNGVTTVGQNAFRDCTALESVTLPTGLKSIRNVAFYNCNCAEFKEINIPEGVETIGESAFGFSALEKITIPSSVTSIGASVFYRCSALTAIDVDDANENYSSENGILFDKIDAGDEGGGDEGGGSGGEAGGGSGEEGGEGGEGEGGEGGEGEGGEQTAKNKTLLIWYPAAKTDETYEVPDGVKTIGSYAFVNALHLKKITLPEGLTTIEPYAFAYGVLNEVHAPTSLATVGERAFYECRNLSTTDENNEIKSLGTVYFAGSRPQWNSIKIGSDNNCLTNANIVYGDMKQDAIVAKGECGALGSNAIWSLTDKGDFLISGTGAMSGYKSAAGVPWASYPVEGGGGDGEAQTKDLRDDIKTVTIEGDIVEEGVIVKSGITNVGDYAFSDCANLTTVKLPSTVKTVGARAFSNCAALSGVSLSDTSATTVGDYAFNGTAALKNVIFPKTLKTVGKQAFMRSGLTEVTIPASVTGVGDWAFRWCESLETFSMAALASGETPHKSASIGNYALANCAALTKVNFTQNLASLGEYALADCVTLDSDKTGVVIPESVFNIGSCAFHGCAVLTAVNVDEDNITYCSASGMLMNKDKTCIYYYPAGRAEDTCAIPESVGSVVAFAFDGANNLQNVIFEGTEKQWKALIEAELPEGEQRTRIGPYNDPLLNAAVTWQDDPDASEYITRVKNVDIDKTAHQLTVVVHCGLNAETEDTENQGGAYVFCAIYGKDGCFLRLDMPDSATVLAADDDGEELETAQSLTPGTDTELTYTWDEDTGRIRLLILDEHHLPRCKSVEQEISEESGEEEAEEEASPGET